MHAEINVKLNCELNFQLSNVQDMLLLNLFPMAIVTVCSQLTDVWMLLNASLNTAASAPLEGPPAIKVLRPLAL